MRELYMKFDTLKEQLIDLLDSDKLSSIESRRSNITRLLMEVNDNKYNLHSLIEYIVDSDYLTAPASTRFHDNFDGGLVIHSLNLTLNLIRLLQMSYNESLIQTDYDPIDILLIGITHDFCKVGFYYKSDGKYYYRDDLVQMGHAVESIRILTKLISNINEEVIYAIRWHMGTFDLASNDQGPYRNAMKKFPLVYLTQIADMMASGNWVI